MRVEGGSMSPRIAPGQMIEIQQGPAECLGTLKRGDVVLFHSDSSRVPLIKALRGLAGDKFSVSDGKIVINGTPATNSAGESYRLSPPRAAMIGLYVHDDHGMIPSNSFLVMGENPAGSLDSSRFGLVTRQAIIGKLVENDVPRADEPSKQSPVQRIRNLQSGAPVTFSAFGAASPRGFPLNPRFSPFVLSPDGYVGIGTASPASAIDLGASTRVWGIGTDWNLNKAQNP
jgi:signal peptidase I